jgi:hypothetical protein
MVFSFRNQMDKAACAATAAGRSTRMANAAKATIVSAEPVMPYVPDTLARKSSDAYVTLR